MADYNISIDPKKCIAAASCVAVAINTFSLNQDNVAEVINETGDSSELILLAAQSCPTQAITLKDKKSGQQIWPKP